MRMTVSTCKNVDDSCTIDLDVWVWHAASDSKYWQQLTINHTSVEDKVLLLATMNLAVTRQHWGAIDWVTKSGQHFATSVLGCVRGRVTSDGSEGTFDFATLCQPVVADPQPASFAGRQWRQGVANQTPCPVRPFIKVLIVSLQKWPLLLLLLSSPARLLLGSLIVDHFNKRGGRQEEAGDGAGQQAAICPFQPAWLYSTRLSVAIETW